MKIYRVENDEGLGPYTIAGYNVINKYYSDPFHPPIRYEDMNLYNSISSDIRSYWFGFDKIESLYNWFFDDNHNEELREDFNFKVSCYNVSSRHVVKFKKQLIFKKEHSKLLYQMKLKKPSELVL